MKLFGLHESFNSSTMFIENCSIAKGIFIIRSPSPSYLKSIIAVCILNVIFGIVGTFLNTLVLFVFFKSKNMRQNTGYLSIMILSATDLIVVTTIPAVFLVNAVPEILGTPRCLYSIFCNIVMRTTHLLSANSLIIMNIERYLAIMHPLFHHTTVTRQKLIWSFGILVCFFLICAAINLTWHQSIGGLIYSVLAFIICSTTLFQYVSIFNIARKASTRRIADVNNKEISSSRRLFLRDLKMARTYFYIVFLCFLCYLPIAILSGISQHFFANEETRNAYLHWRLSVTPLISMNATLNCLIFFWGNMLLRKQGWKLIKTVRK